MATATDLLPIRETHTPADEAAVAEVIRAAAADGTAVYPIGGGVSLDYGAVPQRQGVGLSLEKLDRVVDHAVDDLTITVEPGLTMARLQEQLAEKRQRLPVDAPQPQQATIGGLAATGFSGPLRYGHGTLRDFVIGARAVDGQGAVFSGGGRVVKNAAGYNLHRLLVGSMGTLGVVTQLTLMVRPMPEATAVAACDVADLPGAEKLLAGLVETKTLPVAVELHVGDPQDNPLLGPVGQGCTGRLYVGFEGAKEEVDWMLDRLAAEWSEAGAGAPMTMADDESLPLWRWLAEFDAQVQIHVRPGDVVEVVGQLRRLDPECLVRSHAGNGAILVRFDALQGDALVEAAVGQLRPAVAELGGSLTLLSCQLAPGLSIEDVWGPADATAVVMRALKDRFDPAGVLNPGRYVFG